MGLTRFSGPIYGAKCVLLSVSKETISSGGGNGLSTTIGKTIVPVYEDWYITEFTGSRASSGSTSHGISLDDDGTVLSSITFNSSTPEANTLNTLTAAGGEYEGALVAGGSTLSVFVGCSSAVSASSGITASVRGYIRWIASSRAF